MFQIATIMAVKICLLLTHASEALMILFSVRLFKQKSCLSPTLFCRSIYKLVGLDFFLHNLEITAYFWIPPV